MINTVIFDMDGLMIDSERVTCDGYAVALSKRGYEPSTEFYKRTLGTTTQTTYKMYQDYYGSDIPFFDILDDVHQYIEDYFQTKGVPIKKGLIELLTYLKEHHYQIVVATSSDRCRVDQIFKQANLVKYFDEYVCGNEVTHGKPNPEVFLKACQKISVNPSDAIVLEDSEAGIQAAYSAHIPVICIPDMKYPEKQYEEMTRYIVNSLVDVIDILEDHHDE